MELGGVPSDSCQAYVASVTSQRLLIKFPLHHVSKGACCRLCESATWVSCRINLVTLNLLITIIVIVQLNWLAENNAEALIIAISMHGGFSTHEKEKNNCHGSTIWGQKYTLPYGRKNFLNRFGPSNGRSPIRLRQLLDLESQVLTASFKKKSFCTPNKCICQSRMEYRQQIILMFKNSARYLLFQ